MLEQKIPANPLRCCAFQWLQSTHMAGPSGNGMLKPLSSDISSTAISASESSPATSQLDPMGLVTWIQPGCGDGSRMVKSCHHRWTFLLCIYIYTYTSSTAQGGGGSFKNRKPIGESGCCESRMAERSH